MARRARCFTDRIGIAVPSTLPWCDRPDSHRLRRGSRSRAASTLASTTVRPGGLAPPTTRLSGKRSSIELRPGNVARSGGFEPPPLHANIRCSALPIIIPRRLEVRARQVRDERLSYRRATRKYFVQTVGFEPTTSRVKSITLFHRPDDGRKARKGLSALPAELRLQSV